MKNFEVRVTQPMIGYYYGWLNVQAENEREAIEKMENMSNEEIDSKVEWFEYEEAVGDTDNIEIEFDTLTEL